MKIYTKTGDKGTTGLLGGTRVSKHHYRIEAYGTVDELNAHIAYLVSFDIDEKIKKDLILIQDRLFTVGSNLANDNKRNIKLPGIYEENVKSLEKKIDEMDKELSPLTGFVLPGGNPASAYCHICRTVCRRAERRISALMEEGEVDEIFLTYINRLSDFLFTLSRKLLKDFNSEEITWKAKLCK